MEPTDQPEGTDRFDTFTERARKVLTLAQEEATRFNHNYIGTEHLLLGLVREGEGVAAKVLANLGVELNRVRSAVEFIIGRGDRMIVGEIGLTPRAKKVIELAVDEARRLGHHYVGTEHLLLGLVREGEGIAAGVLESLGVNLEKVRAETIRVLSGSNAPAEQGATGPMPTPAEVRNPPGSAPATRFDTFTERARKVLTLAREEATRLNHPYIGTEHLLLGLVREGEGVAAKVLANLGVELDRVRDAVEHLAGRGDHVPVGEVGLTPRSKKVIELAIDEARRLGHHYISTEHLLLGLVREGEGLASGVLQSLGVNLEKVRTQTVQILSQSSASSARAEASPTQPGQGTAEASIREWVEAGPSRPMTGGRQARWEYLIVGVAYAGPGGGGVVRGLDGGADEARFGRDATPIRQALEALGAEGWELAAVDPSVKGSGAADAHYILKRPL